ncbi:MAG: amidohydrolase family protein [Desulfobacterales bacterium]|nr:amidohydrolase family protein [Desulfobacterales bacterium]
MNNTTKKTTYILAGWLIDGSGGRIRKKSLLKLVDGQIIEISNYGNEPVEISDLSHCTILPPLIDSHVHLFMSGTLNKIHRKNQLVANFDDIKNVISRHMNNHLAYGILAVRDAGDAAGHALRYKNQCLDGDIIPVILKAAGKAWHRKGRYGKLIGRSPSENETLASAIANDHSPVDHIKIVNSGLNSLTQYGKETPPQFEREEMKAAVCHAEKAGLKVMVHTNGKIPVNISIHSGCHSIEHGFFMGRENLIHLAEKNIFWVPTAITMKAYTEYSGKKYSKKETGVPEKNLIHQLKQMAMAKKYGVRIALGTDSGSIGVHHGKAVIGEIKLLMEAGYSTAEAVMCATYNGSKLLDIDTMGLIAEGRQATFIAVKGDPSEFPDNLNHIESIYINGRPLDG